MPGIEEDALPERPRTADLTLPPIGATGSNAFQRAVQDKEVESSLSELIANVRTLITRSKARTAAEVTVLKNAVRRACRSLGDKTLVAEVDKLQVAWGDILKSEEQLADAGKADDLATAQEHRGQEAAGVALLEKRMQVAQAKTRKIESEKMACEYKFSTLKTDMEEEFQNRVKYLTDLTEEQEKLIAEVDEELAKEEDRRAQLRDSLGAKAETREMELAQAEMILAAVVAHVKELMAEAADLEEQTSDMLDKVKDAKAEAKLVESHFEDFRNIAEQAIKAATSNLKAAEAEADRVAILYARELKTNETKHEEVVMQHMEGTAMAKQAREESVAARIAAEEATQEAEKELARIEEQLKEFQAQFDNLNNRKAELLEVKKEVEVLRVKNQQKYSERSVLETDRDMLLKAKVAFEKRRAAAPATAQERCAWRMDWLRSLRSRKARQQAAVAAFERESEAHRQGLEDAKLDCSRKLEKRYAQHAVHMMSARASHSLIELLQPGAFDELEAEAARVRAEAEQSAKLAQEAAEADIAAAEREAQERVVGAEAHRRDKVAALTAKVEGTLGAATAAMAEKKRELELRLIEWKQQSDAFIQETMKQDKVAQELMKRNAEIESANLTLGSEVAVAKAVAKEHTAEANKVKDALQEKERIWVKRLSGLRDRLEKEKADLELELGKDIAMLKDRLGGIPEELAEAEEKVRKTERELDTERENQKKCQEDYDRSFKAYSSLQEQLIRADSHTRLIATLGDTDASLLELATRSLQKEFLSQEQELRSLLEE